MDAPEANQRREAALRLGFGTGTALPEQTRLRSRILVIGDFGRKRSDVSPAGLTVRGEAPASLPEQFEVTVRCSCENLLASDPPQLSIELPIRRLSDFTTRSLVANIEVLRRAAALKQAAAAGYDGLEGFADLDKMIAALDDEPSPVPARADGPAPNDADLLQSILGGEDRPAPAARSTGLSSLIGAIALPAGGPAGQRRPLKERLAAVDAVVARQIAAIRGCPGFAAIESVWRGLQLLLRNAGRDVDLQIDLLDTAAEDVAACLLRDVVPDEIERVDDTPLCCTIVLGAVPASVEGIERLAFCAAAGAALHVPVLVSLQHGFAENLSEEIAAAWALLRSDDHTRWLAACDGDLVLNAEEREIPLWGEPAWAVGALIVASLVRTGWPCDLVNPGAATVEGLGLHELRERGASSMWPVRRPVTTRTLAQFHQLGIISLAARPNRDHVFLTAAPTVAVGDDNDAQPQLADQLLASWLTAHLRAATLVVGGASDAEWAEAIRQILAHLLPPSSAPRLRVEPYPRDDPAARRSFRIEVAAALPGLDGRPIHFDYTT